MLCFLISLCVTQLQLFLYYIYVIIFSLHLPRPKIPDLSSKKTDFQRNVALKPLDLLNPALLHNPF